MPANEIHQGDIGTVFVVTIKDGDATVNISGANVKNLIFLKPDGNKITRAGTLYTDGTDGKLKYVSVSGDLDVHGTWKMQGRIEINPSGWNSDISSFKVYRNL